MVTTHVVAEAPPHTAAAGRLLDAAARLFYEEGIGAVGVERIAEEAGTTKKTLYDRFGSKEGLVVAYLRRRHARFTAHVAAALETVPPGEEAVLAVFDALASWLDDNARGCGFINAYAELAGSGHAGLEVVAQEKAWVLGLFGELLTARPDVDTLARTLAMLYEGTIVRSTAGGDPRAPELARDTAARLLAGPA